jgi:hypothetical protein
MIKHYYPSGVHCWNGIESTSRGVTAPELFFHDKNEDIEPSGNKDRSRRIALDRQF